MRRRSRQPAMTHAFRPAVLFIAVALLLAACASGGAAPSAAAPPSEAPPVAEPPALEEPGVGGAELVEPQPGQQDIHPVTIEQMQATSSGRVVSVDAYWTSGVDPCYVLDHVEVAINDDDQTIDLTVLEGTSDPDAICVMMAVTKHTIVSFEVPATGTWTIRDSQGGGASPIEVVVS